MKIFLFSGCEVDLDERQLFVNMAMSSTHLYSRLKELWIGDKRLQTAYFPFDAVSAVDLKLINGWSFDSADSYRHVTPNVVFERPVLPESPLAVQNVVAHKTQYFADDVALDELLRHVPDGTNLMSTRVSMDGDRVTLDVPGQWPNPHFERDMVRLEHEVEEFKRAYTRYERRVMLWQEINRDAA